ncbi:MAG: hypothetical protein OEY74_04725 [Gammaproteobacteria bacterium]|nr:hypothetical protein [Gammaproteobacteria bacterium]
MQKILSTIAVRTDTAVSLAAAIAAGRAAAIRDRNGSLDTRRGMIRRSLDRSTGVEARPANTH